MNSGTLPSIATVMPVCFEMAMDQFETGFSLLTRDERKLREKEIYDSGKVTKRGSLIHTGKLRRAGEYLIGPVLGSSPVLSMVQCLSRKKDSDQFCTLKILTIRDTGEESQDDRQGKMLLHTEHSLLSLLAGQPGIIQHHGLFQDYACDATMQPNDRTLVATGNLVRRICLVLDCVTPHNYSTSSYDYVNLQHYVISRGKLSEVDALSIFHSIATVVHNLHKQNVVHRDLKLANLVLNQHTRQVILTNFCLGQHLVSDDDLLQDQRGSPAYISPDVLSGKPYKGKPSDMWALGVVLFTMLYGEFPFYDRFPRELFRRIKTAEYDIPYRDENIKEDTLDLVKGLLMLDPEKRLTAGQVLSRLDTILTLRASPQPASIDNQVVPEFDLKDVRSCQLKIIEPRSNDLDNVIRKQSESCFVYLSATRKMTAKSSSINRRIGDTRSLTSSEFARFKHLLPTTTGTSDNIGTGGSKFNHYVTGSPISQGNRIIPCSRSAVSSGIRMSNDNARSSSSSTSRHGLSDSPTLGTIGRAVGRNGTQNRTRFPGTSPSGLRMPNAEFTSAANISTSPSPSTSGPIHSHLPPPPSYPQAVSANVDLTRRWMSVTQQRPFNNPNSPLVPQSDYLTISVNHDSAVESGTHRVNRPSMSGDTVQEQSFLQYGGLVPHSRMRRVARWLRPRNQVPDENHTVANGEPGVQAESAGDHS